MAPPKIQAVLDTTYSFNPRSDINLVRGFDRDAQTFNPNAELILEFPTDLGSGDSVSGVVDLGVGRNFALTQSTGLNFAYTDAEGNPQPLPVDAVQAYVELKKGYCRGSAGKRVTLANYWVIRTDKNPLISPPWIFHYAVPYAGTGIRVGCGNDTVDGNLEINSGWDVVTEENPRPGYVGNVTLNGGRTSLVTTFLAGPEGPGGEWRLLGDSVLTWKPDDAFQFILNYDNGGEQNGAGGWNSWQGGAAYLVFGRDDGPVKAVLRAELFSDPDGVRTAIKRGFKALGLTVALEFRPVDGLSFLLEGRRDEAIGAVPFDGEPGQTTFAGQLRYSYAAP